MAHLLTPAATTTATALSSRPWKSSFLYSRKNGCFPTPRVCCVGNQYEHQLSDQNQVPPTHDDHSLRRRALMGLSGVVVLGLSWRSDEQIAIGAGRPPPPPPREKKDPNVSGVQAKVMASKRRKEAMQEAMAKLRAKGKAINDTTNNKELPPAPAPAPAPVPPPPAPE